VIYIGKLACFTIKLKHITKYYKLTNVLTYIQYFEIGWNTLLSSMEVEVSD